MFQLSCAAPYFIKQGPGQFALTPIRAALWGQAGCKREMWSQVTPPQPLLLHSARSVTASRSLVTSRDYLSSAEMHWQAAGGEPKATAKHEAGMAPASQHHVLPVLGILPLLPPMWAWACVRQGSASHSVTHTHVPRLHRDTAGESHSLPACPQLRAGAKPELLDHGNAVMQQGAGLASCLGQASL